MEEVKRSSLCDALPEHVASRVYQDIGQASMCWEYPEKAGTFFAEMAGGIAHELCVFIADELKKHRE